MPQSGPKLPAAYNKYPQAQHHSLSRPLTDFDKELALLVESNKPVAINHQAQPLPRPSPLKQSQQQIVQIPQRQSHNEPIYAPQHLPPPQNLRYAVPANIQYTPQQKPSQSNTKPQRFESPAHRYQLLSYPTQQQQQQQQPQSQHPQLQHHVRPDFQDPQIQFYFPKEKDIQAQQQYQDVPQHLIYETQGVMKIVDPPQLQYQQPQEGPQRPQSSSKFQQSSKKTQHQLQAQQSSQSVQQQESQQRPSAPTRSQIYVSRTTQGPPIPNQPQPQQPQSEKPKLPPLKLDPNRPLTQEEFQRLVDQGYNVVPVPVPVPYPVHIK